MHPADDGVAAGGHTHPELDVVVDLPAQLLHLGGVQLIEAARLDVARLEDIAERRDAVRRAGDESKFGMSSSCADADMVSSKRLTPGPPGSLVTPAPPAYGLAIRSSYAVSGQARGPSKGIGTHPSICVTQELQAVAASCCLPVLTTPDRRVRDIAGGQRSPVLSSPGFVRQPGQGRQPLRQLHRRRVGATEQGRLLRERHAGHRPDVHGDSAQHRRGRRAGAGCCARCEAGVGTHVGDGPGQHPQQDCRPDRGESQTLAILETSDNGKPVRELLAADLPLAFFGPRTFRAPERTWKRKTAAQMYSGLPFPGGR